MTPRHTRTKTLLLVILQILGRFRVFPFPSCHLSCYSCYFLSLCLRPPPYTLFLAASGSSDGVTVCVLLFVMKIGFQQMDGEILEEKCNLKESSTEKDGLLSLQASSLPNGAVVGWFYFVCVSSLAIVLTPHTHRIHTQRHTYPSPKCFFSKHLVIRQHL